PGIGCPEEEIFRGGGAMGGRLRPGAEPARLVPFVGEPPAGGWLVLSPGGFGSGGRVNPLRDPERSEGCVMMLIARKGGNVSVRQNARDVFVLDRRRRATVAPIPAAPTPGPKLSTSG